MKRMNLRPRLFRPGLLRRLIRILFRRLIALARGKKQSEKLCPPFSRSKRDLFRLLRRHRLQNPTIRDPERTVNCPYSRFPLILTNASSSDWHSSHRMILGIPSLSVSIRIFSGLKMRKVERYCHSSLTGRKLFPPASCARVA